MAKEEEDGLYTDVATAPLEVATHGSTVGDSIIRALLASPSSSVPIARGKYLAKK